MSRSLLRRKGLTDVSRAFILASLVTHLPQRDDVARDAKATEPDLGPGRARSNIVGYIFGVTPGLAIWIVFGLTMPFRRVMYELACFSWRKKHLEPLPPPQHPWASSSHRSHLSATSRSSIPEDVLNTNVQLGNMDPYTPSNVSTEFMITPLLTHSPPGHTRSGMGHP